MIDFIKANFVAFIMLIVFLVWVLSPTGCGTRKNQEPIITTETKWEKQPPVYIPQYIPVESSNTPPIIIPPQYQPDNSNMEKLLAQYNELLQDYLTQRKYTDSVTLRDSTGRRVGVFTNNDLVEKNRLASREPSYQLEFPHTTVTIREPYRPVNKLYLGVGLQGTPQMPVNGGSAKILWQGKNEGIFGISGGGVYQDGIIQPQFEISKYWKLSLKKQ